MKRVRSTDPQTKHNRSITIDATIPGLAKEAEGSSTTGASRVCSNGGSRKNKNGNDMPQSEGRDHVM